MRAKMRAVRRSLHLIAVLVGASLAACHHQPAPSAPAPASAGAADAPDTTASGGAIAPEAATTPEATPAAAPQPDAASADNEERLALLARMKGFRDDMCACHDKACATHVKADLDAWLKELQARTTPPPHMTKDDEKTAGELGEAMGKCMGALQRTKH